jgi:pimeloyl-ACP methyl ester carboxylesterase
VCLLVDQGGWQFVLHPAPTVDKTPAIPYQPVRFDAAETGQPRLTGWWIAADNPAAPTGLFLHDGSGSLSVTVPTLQLLHQANVNIFAIDYRGFGQSGGPHPTESRMAEDAAAALDYLVGTRHIAASGIIPYGQGLGAALAARLAVAHPELPAVIVENPDPDAYRRATHDSRAGLLPMSLLLQERFDIAAALDAVRQPKLLLADSPYTPVPPARIATNQALFRAVPDPKFIVTFDNAVSGGMPYYAIDSEHDYVRAVTRFLDEYVAAPIPVLKGAP